MSFVDEIRMVLELERKGKERLAAARADAEKIREEGRESVRQLATETDRKFSRRKEEEMARMDEAVGRELDAIRQRTAAEEKRLRTLADKTREAAVERVMAWLWEER